jgi:hypothetical protein
MKSILIAESHYLTNKYMYIYICVCVCEQNVQNIKYFLLIAVNFYNIIQSIKWIGNSRWKSMQFRSKLYLADKS